MTKRSIKAELCEGRWRVTAVLGDKTWRSYDDMTREVAALAIMDYVLSGELSLRITWHPVRAEGTNHAETQ